MTMKGEKRISIHAHIRIYIYRAGINKIEIVLIYHREPFRFML
jgi:hypothetical protein